MRRLATLTIAVFATVLVVLLLWQLRSIVVLFVLSLMIAALVRPPVQFMQGYGVPKVISIVLAYIFIFGGMAILLYSIGGPMIDELDALVETFAAQYRTFATDSGSSLSNNSIWATLSSQMPSADQLDEFLENTASFALMQQVLGVTQDVLGTIGQLSLAVVLSLYWMIDRVRFERLWISLLRPEQRIRARSLWRKVETAVGAYISSKIIQSVLAGFLIMVVNTAIGVEYPFLLSFFTVLVWLIPLVGGWLVTIVAVALSLQSGLVITILSVAATLSVLIGIWFFMERRLYQYDRYGTVLVILILLIMVDALGFIGILTAPLIAIAVQICLNELIEPVELTEYIDDKINLVELRQRLREAQKLIEEEEEPSPRIDSLQKRVDTLLQKVETATYGRTV